MRTLLCCSLIIVPLALMPCAALGAGTVTHNTASLSAARLAPEPFAGNWEKCRYAVHPDYMRDQPLGHENARTAGILYTMEAIRYLREGQINRAMMTASARSHYITDGACIPHAAIWSRRAEKDVLRPGQPGSGPWSFMPASVQGYWLPLDERAEGTHFNPLRIAPPALKAEAWERLKERSLYRSMHAFFDSIHGQAPYPDGFPLEGIDHAEGWSCYDREFYARWRAECIALSVLDRESVLDDEDGVRFVSADELQAAMDEEMRNMISAVLAYYRYLATAAHTELRGDIDELLPAADRLLLLARRSPQIHLAKAAPRPLRRAVHLLASELVRAENRLHGRQGREYGRDLRAACEAVIVEGDLPAAEADRRIVISWQETETTVAESCRTELEGDAIVCEQGPQAAGHIILRGEDLQSTIHLVDYLLDLANAPLNGRTPVEVMLRVFEREWPGRRFLDKLRQTPDPDIYQPDLERPPCPHVDDMAEWTDKVHWMVWPNTQGDANLSGPLPVLWNLMLFELPLPDGTKLDLSAL